MASPLLPSFPPLREPDLIPQLAAYSKALEKLTIPQLLSLANEIAAAQQAQAQGALLQTLSDYHRMTDSPVLRSTPPGSPSLPSDRPAPPSSSPRPQAWELLSNSNRLGPRLAAKLVVSSVRSQSRRNG